MEKLYFAASQFYATLVKDIEAAKSSITIETYTLSDDAAGRPVIDALVAAAARGVDVKLLVDSAGSPSSVNQLIDEVIAANGQSRIYHPMPWRWHQWRYASYEKNIIFKLIYLCNVINRRNHRKITYIDQSTLWIGSYNLTQEHLEQAAGGDGWRDTAIRCTNKRAPAIEQAFKDAWQGKLSRSAALYDETIQLNHKRRLRRQKYRQTLQRIHQAQDTLWLTNAYFIPERRLLKALCDAAQRNVDVRILLPEKSDMIFMPWASSHFYHQLLAVGVNIYEYHVGVLHAKTMIIDQWSRIGSSNLNHRSLLHDLEVDIIPASPDVTEELRKQFLRDLEKAQAIDRNNIRQYTLWKRLIGRLTLALRYFV